MTVTLATIILGEQFATQYGIGISIGSIIIGNLCLWLIGMVMITMSYQDRTNAIQNARNYLGKYGGILSAIILTFAFINWFVIVLNSTLFTVRDLFGSNHFWSVHLIRFGAGLGILATLFSLGQIRLLKWVTSIACPFILLYHLYAGFVHGAAENFDAGKWDFSYQGIVITMMVLFPGMINIPTIFRYSRSRAHSYLGLTLFIVFLSTFQISSIWMPFTKNLEIHYTGSFFPIFFVLTLLFLLFKALFANVLNIYLASASWETFFPHFEGTKGNVIMGLLSTAVYTFIQIAPPTNFLRDLINAYLANLAAVLLISFICQIVIKHRPRMKEKTISGLAWLFGCFISTISLIFSPQMPIQALFSGIGAGIIFFLLVIFLEETFWSIKRIFFDKSDL